MTFFYFDDEINSFRGEYSWLSNFHKCECWWADKLYPSSEHLYQAFKATNDTDHEFLRNHPFEGIKSSARQIKLRDDWEEVKLEMMGNALWSKFSNNPDLKDKLLATGDVRIVEGNDWCDNFYGQCRCPKCERTVSYNHLGLLLMDLREYFKLV